jgi:GGDEF domain-containing protein
VKIVKEEELLEKIKELEQTLENCRQREKEIENMLREYNELVKRQFEMFDDFVRDIGTKRMIDPLTRVYSKDHIMKLISYYHEKAFEENSKYGILIVRITNLEKLLPLERESNLVLLGKSLRDSVRVPLDSVGRYSEDTFIILLTDISKENAEKVRKRVEDMLKLQLGDEVKFKTSLKIYPENGEDLEKLINQALEEVK